ncbi:MAG: beta-ketoacyl-ACP synthase III [Undibacterium sp.]|uniref:beta-ketoacyl-ACP synthase III n=1 Tax=Undibacterium sp. TaxID=1914977 RepID=UPI00271926BF|nr:beta-ketoacyl-ACP synthase III [Undibacterium sp.]MDO8653412.1 beta-ketoacyl-ACP synthase III [Undibacterium sp.]
MTFFSKIIGTGSYLPPKRVTNQDLTEQLAANGIETSDEWIFSRSGISARHYAEPSVTSSDMAVEAAKRALEAANLQANDIDLIILATSTPDFFGGFPSTACVVQHKLGMTNGAAAVDVQAVCSGFIYAMAMADSMIKSGAHKNALIMGAEVFSRILNFEDRATCVLFGDGAGAIVMSQSAEPGVLATKLHADGSQSHVLCVPGNVNAGVIAGSAFLYMDGKAVYKIAVNVLEKVANEVLAIAGLTSEQIDWLVPHQANIRIMQSTAKKLNMPMDKVIVTVDQHGNTSAASIPLALDVAVRDGRIKKGQTVMLEGVGGGFTWGAAIVKM